MTHDETAIFIAKLLLLAYILLKLFIKIADFIVFCKRK
jgi:hypothetical protein